jgi:predicted RNase H-like HicB family nuclease
MLTAYIRAAMTHAQLTWLPESAMHFGEIPETPGVWATGATEDACREELQEVLEDWIQLGLARGRRLPIVDGIDINVSLEAAG